MSHASTGPVEMEPQFQRAGLAPFACDRLRQALQFGRGIRRTENGIFGLQCQSLEPFRSYEPQRGVTIQVGEAEARVVGQQTVLADVLAIGRAAQLPARSSKQLRQAVRDR